MNEIIDSIRLSGVTYQLQGSGGGEASSAITSGDTNPVQGGVLYDKFDEVEQVTAAALNIINDRLSEDEEVTAAGLNALNEAVSASTRVVNVTQAEYDALVSGGTADPTVLYNITDATATDISQYWTSAQTNSAITQAVSGKQDTLVSGTNIKTINNESILGSGNIDIQGGSTYTAGRGISITNDTISFNLPISANTNNSVVMGGKMTNAFTNNGRDCLMVGSDLTTNNGSDGCLVVGYRCSVNGDGSAVIGWTSRSIGDSAFAFGTDVSAKTSYSFATGHGTLTNNQSEHASGQYNNSVSASTTFGNSGNTLFSVGNGTAGNARHNAFEIRQNGDIYLTKDGQDVKLQDQLGGSSITVDTALNSGSTNPVENRVIYNKFDEVEQVTAAGLNALNDRVSEDEEVTAASLNALNDNFGGLKLVKLTQSEYDALSPNYDSNTLYVIFN